MTRLMMQISRGGSGSGFDIPGAVLHATVRLLPVSALLGFAESTSCRRPGRAPGRSTAVTLSDRCIIGCRARAPEVHSPPLLLNRH